MYIILGADGQEYGPVTADRLRQWIAENRANAQTRIRPEGATQWKLLGELPEFAPQLSVVPPSAVAPLPFSITPTPRTNQMAVAGMVLGILAITLGCCCYGLPFNVAGIICSSMALSQISQDPINQQGKAFAIAGLVLSIFSIVFSGLLLAFSLTGSDLLKKLHR